MTLPSESSSSEVRDIREAALSRFNLHIQCKISPLIIAPFEYQFLQLGEHRTGFLLSKMAFQNDYSLVTIHPDTTKLPVQSCQFLIEIEQRTNHFYHPQGLMKYPCLDERR